MMKYRRCILLLALAVAAACAACAPGRAPSASGEITVRLDGDKTWDDGPRGAVVTTMAGGTTSVTLTQPGTYRVSGALGDGRLTVDLGEAAAADPEAVVTVILQGVELTASDGPALWFYRLYEGDPAKPGGRLILGDGTESRLTAGDEAAVRSGAHLSVGAETAGDACALSITSGGAGLAVEGELGLLGGRLHVDTQGDGVAAESVRLTGGVVTVNAGLSGIWARESLRMSGGDHILLAGGCPLQGDGGLYLDGGTVTALGEIRPQADPESAQPRLSLGFAQSQPRGTRLVLLDGVGRVAKDYTAVRPFGQMLFSSPQLEADGVYSLFADGRPQRRGVDAVMGFGSGALTPADGGEYADLCGFGDIPFSDLRPDDPRYPGVQYAFAMGIMNGVGETVFSPDALVSRAMAVTVLGRLAGAEAGAAGGFSDVPPGAWYADYVGWAATSGIVQGDGGGRFLPDDPVTGEAMSLMLSRLARLVGRSSTVESTSREALSRGELAQMLLQFGQPA